MTDFSKGQTVTFAENATGTQASNSWRTRGFTKGETAEVTTVRKKTITVKIDNYSFNVPRASLAAPNGEVWTDVPKPPTRKIGETPADGIAADDPRLAWLWEDAAKLATRSGYCNVYDRIADELNIPGRLRNIEASITVDGLTLSATVKARSRKEAQQKIREKLAASAK